MLRQDAMARGQVFSFLRKKVFFHFRQEKRICEGA